MNLRYLGDALDHWKGSLFAHLVSDGALHDLSVDAMASDAEQWSANDWLLFAKLCKVNERQVIKHDQLLAVNRPEYFGEIIHDGDLFLDPDTGIATGRVADDSQYLIVNELHDLLERAPKKVIAVYQHIRAQRTR